VYLRDFRISGIKCFEDVHLHFSHDGDDYSGWIVLLGGNGMGKSTLLQAIAIALVGPLGGLRLLPDPDGWVRTGKTLGNLSATIIKGRDDRTERQSSKRTYNPKFAITGREQVMLEGILYDQPQLVQLADDRSRNELMKGPYASRKFGWCSFGYGPFRRMSGGSEKAVRLMNPNNRESRFVTLFREDASLGYITDELPSLYRKSIDPNYPDRIVAGEVLETVRKTVDALLPGDVRIRRVSTEDVYFRGAGGAEVGMLDLSDGYRSFLAMAIDILYRWGNFYQDPESFIEKDGDSLRITFEGVILIDEVDAHLHPFWQREIGSLLRRTFPRIQFIVTSHSPFVAQAASDGGLVVLRSTGPQGPVEAERPVESVKGWRVDQILTSPLFGLAATRDEETESLIRAHADLVAKRAWGQLGPGEKKQLSKIEMELASRLTAPGETMEDREREAEMARYVKETIGQLEAKR